MEFGQFIDVLYVILNLAGLVLCLFNYFKHTGRPLTYAVCFFLGNLLSNYYWGVYLLVMNDYPNVSSLLAYFGWNIAFPALFFMMYFLRREKSRGLVSPIALLLIPVNATQLVLYLRYGGIFNNIWQVGWTTAAMILALDSVIYYLGNRRQGERFPYIDTAVLIYLATEYLIWTLSCFDWPSEMFNPYNYISLVICLCYVIIPLTISKEYSERKTGMNEALNRPMMKMFRPLFVLVVIVCCTGGYFLALWMRNTISSVGSATESTDPYNIIAVTLFIVSAVVVSFTLVMILVVDSEKKSYEREETEKARFLAERANSAKSDFLANMSHEIRTPINAVLGMNEMISRESLMAGDELPESRDDIKKIFSEISVYSGNIESAGKNLLSIVNDILDFSKIEAGKLEIVKSRYYLSSVLNDVYNMIKFKAQSKDLDFIVDVNEKIPDELMGDEVRIRQITINLLNNAVKYTHRGKVTLSVSMKKDRVREDLISLVIAVKDTGIGIREEDRERLFGKFERMEIEKNSSIEGTGLGLAITAGLTEMMQGTISVSSKYGRGSTFTVMIPQEVVSKEPIGDFRRKSEKSVSSVHVKRETFRAEDVRILVVDDTPMNLSVVTGLLRNTGIKIDTSVSGSEAVRLAENRRYDVIFMDQRMPEMDGTVAMKKIKEDGSGPNAKTPCVCLTADAVNGAREKYLSEGFADYLSKPIDSRELEKILLTCIPEEKIRYIDSDKTENSGTESSETENSGTESSERENSGTESSGTESSETESSETESFGTENSGTENSGTESSGTKTEDIETTENIPSGVPAKEAPETVSADGPGTMINRETGLKYCDGDEAFYEELLSEFASESVEKLQKLEKTYEEGNWKDYGIYSHSLKSTSKMIGAAGLSGIALEMERAADERNEEVIKEGHKKMIEAYQSTVREIKGQAL